MHKKTDKQIQNANETNTEIIPNEIPESENNVFNEQTIVSPIPAAEIEIESSEPSANMAEEKKSTKTKVTPVTTVHMKTTYHLLKTKLNLILRRNIH